jgi:hypothetical protein
VEKVLFLMALKSKVYPDLVSINQSNILALAVLAHCFPPTDCSYLNMFIPYAASSQDELVKAFLVTEPSGSYIRRELTVFAVVPAQPAATKEVSGLFIVPSRVAMTRKDELKRT